MAAWLLVNSIRTERIQFAMLQLQNLGNVWLGCLGGEFVAAFWEVVFFVVVFEGLFKDDLGIMWIPVCWMVVQVPCRFFFFGWSFGSYTTGSVSKASFHLFKEDKEDFSFFSNVFFFFCFFNLWVLLAIKPRRRNAFQTVMQGFEMVTSEGQAGLAVR